MEQGAVAMATGAAAARAAEPDPVQTLLAGEGGRISAGALIGVLLQPYIAAGHPVAIEIDEVSLGSEAALTLACVIRELAANAARHGALSTLGGRVLITGRVARDNCTEALGLTWQEHGGSSGRGRRRIDLRASMLTRTPAREHGGQGSLSSREDGLFYELRLPVA